MTDAGVRARRSHAAHRSNDKPGARARSRRRWTFSCDVCVSAMRWLQIKKPFPRSRQGVDEAVPRWQIDAGHIGPTPRNGYLGQPLLCFASTSCRESWEVEHCSRQSRLESIESSLNHHLRQNDTIHQECQRLDSIIHHVVRHRTHPQALYHRRCYAHRRNRRCCQDGLHRVNLEADTSLSSFVYYNQGLWKVLENACAESVYQAIKAGYRMFDSSSDYANEHESGKGLKRAIDEGLVKREDVFIVTKLWNTFKVSHAARPRGMQGGTGVAYAFGP
jgi:hypothetical protein